MQFCLHFLILQSACRWDVEITSKSAVMCLNKYTLQNISEIMEVFSMGERPLKKAKVSSA